MNISPEQIKQEITALQTALTALMEDVEILDRDILDVVDGSSAATLQRCFIAVQRMMRRCCQPVIEPKMSRTTVSEDRKDTRWKSCYKGGRGCEYCSITKAA
jgi:hypothetical protein